MHSSVAQPQYMYIAISKPLKPNPAEEHLVGRAHRHIIPWASLPHVCSGGFRGGGVLWVLQHPQLSPW